MTKKTLYFILIFLVSLSMPCFSEENGSTNIPYHVSFEGVTDTSIIDTLRAASQLVTLEEYPTATVTALRKRAEADIPNLLQGLRSLAYYNAKVDIKINIEISPIEIVIKVDTGPIYPLVSFKIISDKEDVEIECPSFSLSELNVQLGMDAKPKTILDAEKTLLQLIAKKGYPLAIITKRDVVADQAAKNISVSLFVDYGPLAYFGETSISGNSQVMEAFIRKKIAWEMGDIYDPNMIDRTQQALEASGLFNSIAIIPDEENVDDQGQMPIDIIIIEGKHRTIGFGASYIADLGPGVMTTWEHRNLLGQGERLRFNVDIWWRRQVGKLLYSKPDFLKIGQDLLLVTELEYERTRGFSERFFSFSGLLDRSLNKKLKLQYGFTYKQLKTERSHNNGNVPLFKLPLQLRWRSVNDVMDPTHGASLTFGTIPTLELVKHPKAYFVQNVTGTLYTPLLADHSWVLATKAHIGSILGCSRNNIPPPERLYAGSENTLRGYRYWTVSPLDKDNDPIGGRSMMIFTIEPRWRINEEFGAVCFYEIGNVYSESLPKVLHKQLQSAGLGVRYHTPVGPLRFDIAVPLNRRKGLDSAFQIYFSIGQAF